MCSKPADLEGLSETCNKGQQLLLRGPAQRDLHRVPGNVGGGAGLQPRAGAGRYECALPLPCGRALSPASMSCPLPHTALPSLRPFPGSKGISHAGSSALAHPVVLWPTALP